MDTNDGPPPKGQVRPLTKQLIQSAMFDTWPGNAAVMDFGIESDRHLGALHHAIRHGEVTAEELDSAMGSGEKLTEIAQRGNNPYRDVSFKTAWDDMPIEPDGPEPPVKEPLPIDPETDRAVTELEKSWKAEAERPSHEDNSRLDNLELADEEHERYLDDVAASYGLSREQMEDYYERWGNGEDPEAHSETYEDLPNEATDMQQTNLGGLQPEGAMMPGITAEKAAFREALAAEDKPDTGKTVDRERGGRGG